MPHSGARYHAADHPANRPGGQRMTGDRCRNPAHRGHGAKRKVQGNPGIGQVQHPDKGGFQRCPGPPQPKSRQVRQHGQSGQQREPWAGQLHRIGSDEQQDQTQCQFFHPGVTCGFCARDCVVGEHGNHPSAHDAEHKQHHVQPQRNPCPAGHAQCAQGIEVHHELG